MMHSFTTELATALAADANDVLGKYKSEFHFPKIAGKDCIYFCGNSLGLQPKRVQDAMQLELESWKNLGVGGYHNGPHPWLYYQEYLRDPLAKIVGALPSEVTVMNSLTVNLHLLLLSFYQPNPTRFKIIMEEGAFPSDQYAIETLVKHFQLDPSTTIIEVGPNPGQKTIDTKKILDAIQEAGDQLALVLLGGINYYTGQYFDLATITQAAHAVGAKAGFDLAHVVGNIPLKLHEWEVDFAAWCSYKYLNGGPGAVGGIYVHESHASNPNTPRLGGWWGNEESTRFKMEKGFVPKTNASGWNISTAQVFNTVCLKASLEIFEAVGMEALRNKSVALTAYLSYLMKQLSNLDFEIITPEHPMERGAQLSLYFKNHGKAIHDKMQENGIVVDYREPGVIRVAPCPLYVSFQDVYQFYCILRDQF